VTAINLGSRLPLTSSGLPEGFSRASLKRLPIWPCSERGLPSLPCHHGSWWALTPPFHPYPAPTLKAVNSSLKIQNLPSSKWVLGGLFSVALSWSRLHWVLPSALPCGARTFLFLKNLRSGSPPNSPDLYFKTTNYFDK